MKKKNHKIWFQLSVTFACCTVGFFLLLLTFWLNSFMWRLANKIMPGEIAHIYSTAPHVMYFSVSSRWQHCGINSCDWSQCGFVLQWWWNYTKNCPEITKAPAFCMYPRPDSANLLAVQRQIVDVPVIVSDGATAQCLEANLNTNSVDTAC